MVADTKQIKILLLGGGYTLARLAARLNPNHFVITTTSLEKQAYFLSLGYNCAIMRGESTASVKEVVSKFSGINLIVDSIPPLKQEKPLAGVENVISTTSKLSIKRFIYLSTSGVFGSSDGEIVTEESAANPYSESATYRYESEQSYHLAFGNRLTVLRISGIYGPGRGVGVMLKQGRYTVVEDQDRWSNRIHVDDLVEIILRSIDLKKYPSLPPVMNASDSCPAKVGDLIKYYLRQFDLPEPTFISREEAKQQGRERLFLNQRLSNTLVKEILDLNFKFPSYIEGAGEEFK